MHMTSTSTLTQASVEYIIWLLDILQAKLIESLTKLISKNMLKNCKQVFFILQKLRWMCPGQIQERFKIHDCSGGILESSGWLPS
jgi:hypothetical protein